MNADQSEPMPIVLRCYADCGAFALPGSRKSSLSPSLWTVIFDTETRTDASQGLRFGTYQVRKGTAQHDAGIFYDPETLGPDEIAFLQKAALAQSIRLLTRAEFVEQVLLKFGYDREGTIVGFNLPFDISRIAIRHGSARGKMRGGFTFIVSPHSWRPRIQVKHLNARSALIRFTVPGKQRTGRGMRNRRMPVTPHRGYFVDLKTLAAALTSKSYTLGSLGEFLRIENPKLDTDDHGGPLTNDYIEYAMRDVQTTWECYQALLQRYRKHGLTETPAHIIKSEAGLGKAYLRQMGVLPWRQVQPDFPPEMLGQIMSTYYGGRSEVHIRRKPTRVLYCDFLSMYPTVCTLMGLWKFVIAEGMTCRDSTGEIRHMLDSIGPAELKQRAFWPRLRTLVRVQPQADILPVRASYGGEPQNTIGLNYLTSAEPMWFTLADCIASKLLTGKAPSVIEAITFEPDAPQAGLRSVAIGGNATYRVDPIKADFYRRIIDLRSSVKTRLKHAKADNQIAKVARLNIEQLALKILANATSYGIFVEINVEELDSKQTIECHGSSGRSFPVQTAKMERPGRYFHPLLATLITGAARLMLAITERLTVDAGIDWAFCDTDSMALAQPDGMPECEFLNGAESVRTWFDALNPYEAKGSLLKLEDANFRTDGQPAPLYCFAVSAKRYALYNMGEAGQPLIRKASAHGLGHLMAPYAESDAPRSIPSPEVSLSEIGVDRWQYDLWYQIVSAALAGHAERPALDFHPALNSAAMSRYGATTPELLGWFRVYNQNLPYDRQVRPFGFLTALHARRVIPSSWSEEADRPRRRKPVRPIAPFGRDPAAAVRLAFDRETGAPVPGDHLATYRDVLAQYHLHPEAKFRNADFIDTGHTRRRHILATGFSYIGKEANRLEEQFFLGVDPEAQSEFGFRPEDQEAMLEAIRDAAKRHGVQAVARKAGLSRQHGAEIVKGKSPGGRATLAAVAAAAAALDTSGRQVAAQVEQLMAQVRDHCAATGLRSFARLADVNSGHLGRILAGSRQPSEATLARLRQALRIGRNGTGDLYNVPAVSRAKVPDSLARVGTEPSLF